MTEPQQRYRVVEKLESGGMAEVFRAESEGLQGFRKQVAIKRVLPHLSSKKKFISMFLDEARLSAHLSHSNCVQVFDIGVGDNAFFIVMEFVDGANLKTVIEWLKKRSRDFPVECAVLITHEICKGLAYAHELTDPSGVPMHIVHRDMSPPNVLITKFGEIKIVDFGLAKANSQLEKSEPGIIKGKFSYLSPEAAMGQEVDARTDVFAVGIILWELLAGQRLFLGDSDFQTVKRVQAAVVPPITSINKRVPVELERIINRALARDPAQRYQTARELGIDLSKFMFSYGVTVSTFDIAHLVQGAMRERQRSRPQQTSIIDKLIEEALLEFTSLTEDEKEEPSDGAKPIALEPGGMGGRSQAPYVDVGSWIDEIQVRGAPSQDDKLRASLPSGFAEGNLSVLEEEEEPPASPVAAYPRAAPPPRPPRAAPPLSMASRIPTPLGGLQPAGDAPSFPAPLGAAPLRSDAAPIGLEAPLVDIGQEKKGGMGAAVGIVLALGVVLVAVAAAWFTNLIPH